MPPKDISEDGLTLKWPGLRWWPMHNEGFFICIEGLDKSGKTTQARLLERRLNSLGFKASYTTEPSQGEIGRFIRTRVLRGRKRIPAVAEALLFAIDRFDHAEREINPMLRQNVVVITDRYVYSSLAYQGAAGLDLQWIMEINKFAPIPDMAIYIDVPLGVLASRIKDYGSIMERMKIQRKAHSVYTRLVREGKLMPVDGNRSIEDVSRNILDLVLSRLRH